ncbi:hypothetical protein GALMADRAFT_554125 [Galerina marginata CBS 339.88]|uniref:Uncharacterized protein n=1 Tax=Galerina marginata (strain CBS 339.88) TaxID=685588 RepID=A0A067T662_GALM3|nr:hypothetical protein GALMADRAFT_554125 [Galerina marginata CBS 339.88]
MASRIRRKPQVTYKSPSAEDHVIIILPLSRRSDPPVAKLDPMPSSSRSAHTPKTHGLGITTHRRYPTTPSLPLFHPFGHLAMSLPPLDPTQYGLPVTSTPDDMDHQPSTRLRRPAAKLREFREAEEDMISASPTVSTIAAVAAREAKERASPRKRRTGGAKRKRKDADDGDATYPAKRTRIPRGVPGQNLEDDNSMDFVQSIDTTGITEVFSDLNDTSKRRSTRAKGSLKRRDSSASETTSNSASANVAPGQATVASSSTETPRKAEAADQSLVEDDDKEEKEEGELSEEQNP